MGELKRGALTLEQKMEFDPFSTIGLDVEKLLNSELNFLIDNYRTLLKQKNEYQYEVFLSRYYKQLFDMTMLQRILFLRKRLSELIKAGADDKDLLKNWVIITKEMQKGLESIPYDGQGDESDA